jgi:hypothetical protein
VAITGASHARKLDDKPFAVHRVTGALAALVALGRLFADAGSELAASGKPFWAHAPPEALTPWRALLGVLCVPAGWMVFAQLIPVAMHERVSNGELLAIRSRAGATKQSGGASSGAACLA